MTGAEIIREVQENASEWLEMSENPDKFMSGILAQRIVNLNNRIEYLEKRLDHESRAKVRVN